jgi:DNA-binding MarR family transcriptional regulator
LLPTTTSVEDLVKELYGLGVVRRDLTRHALAELGTQGFSALGILHVHGPLRVSEVAGRLGIDLSVASRQVAALVASGHAVREADPADGRAHRIRVTPAGERALRLSHERMVAAFGHVLADWSGDDVADLTRLLARLREDFARASAAPPSPDLQEIPR